MKPKRIEPRAYFENWAFEVREPLWPALGVTKREYVDRPRTKELRAKALAAGVPKSRILDVKATYFAFVLTPGDSFDFHAGDIFFAPNAHDAIQVMGSVGAQKIEVHFIEMRPGILRLAFHLTPSDLSRWLKSGIEPTSARIPPAKSISETLRYQISDLSDDRSPQLLLSL